MSKILAGVAALTLTIGAAMLSPATAAERHAGISNQQLTDLSSQRRHWRRHYGYYRHHYWGPRRYWGPRYGYYGHPYRRYGYYGYPYYRPGPFVSFGIGPFGFGVF